MAAAKLNTCVSWYFVMEKHFRIFRYHSDLCSKSNLSMAEQKMETTEHLPTFVKYIQLLPSKMALGYLHSGYMA